ncbi:MAG TPA: DinB family protein [Chitinophagaceae bacterium]|nr:DinB family protein [Chitinophagaceae bacterium]
MSATTLTPAPTALTMDQLFNHWMGHRNLTRKMIEKYPEDQFFTFSIGSMRPFSELVLEFLGMAIPSLHGAAYREWKKEEELPLLAGWKTKPTTKQELLDRWDFTTKELHRIWKDLTPERLQEEDVAFGQWPGTMYWLLMYVIDNEIHHRGQGYVYMRALGIEPPYFWDRA